MENDSTIDWSAQTVPPEYVIHARWLLEGVLLPCVGVVGIIGE